MRRYDFTFNDIRAWDKGVAVTERPSIPAPKKRGEYIEVAGRDGALLVTDGTYEPIEFEIMMNYVRRPESVISSFREIKSWLTGSGKLTFADDTDVFYKVKNIEISDFQRRTKFGADLVATVVADPFTYYHSGTQEFNASDVEFNPYHKCCPTYKISANGQISLNVNGNILTANVGGSCIIDTEKCLAYRGQALINTETQGANYEDLRLNSGPNTITISGGTMKVVPNWRSL